ncbi:adenylosuccinate lyase [Candidatus Bathyarchaeota archaeon]|nr:adenylosuccinate lyase [Candidatus Bathyarchaeota archaeon]
MPIIPIDTGRYGTQEMRKVFEEESRLQRLLDVEAALAWAQAQVGEIQKKDANRIIRMASIKYVKLNHVKEIEHKIQHDFMAIVQALAEVCGPSGAYVHLGATSYDIEDTALALQLKDAFAIIERRLNDLEYTLMKLAEKHKETIMIGRTHGQHALPITLGLKFAVWMREVSRHIDRLRQCRERVLVGKMTGAVGTQAGFGPQASEIQKLVMERLGLRPVEVSTQIVQRDRHAEMVCLFAVIASSLDKFATEIRELQRPEIGEVAEVFESEQIGSSTMPHKRNPMTCERICGLAKVMRSLVLPALENVPTWHERDLTQSSAERFIIPEACILLDYMLVLMKTVLSKLQVNKKQMLKNLNLTQGRAMSEAVMLTLARKGLGRQEAYNLIRQLVFKSEVEKRPLREVLLSDPTVSKILKPKEVDAVLNPYNYLGTTVKQIMLAIKTTRKERETREKLR